MKKFNEEQQQVREVSVEGDGVMNSHLLPDPKNTPSGLTAGELHSSDCAWPGSP